MIRTEKGVPEKDTPSEKTACGADLRSGIRSLPAAFILWTDNR